MLKNLKDQKDLHLERMFETRSEAWEKAGLTVDVSQRSIRHARREAVVLLVLLVGVLVVYFNADTLLGVGSNSPWLTPLRIVTVLALLVLGWWIARDVGRIAGPTFFRRMDPATAGTVGFLIRLATMATAAILALNVAGVNPATLVAGSAVTAVVIGLAAQQTLGNLFAGMVLLAARPFRVGERVRLQSGPIAGRTEGVVSSLGLLYTTLANGDDRIMIPNSVVLAAAVVPLKEPESVDVKVRLGSGIRPSQVQMLLDDNITTPTRRAPVVLLEEIDGADVVVRVQATPEHANEGAKLADEIIATLSSVTGEHVAEIINRKTSGEHDTPASGRVPTGQHDTPPNGITAAGDGEGPGNRHSPAPDGDSAAKRYSDTIRRALTRD
jgi:small conductance mechanosensitive channel